MVKTLDVSKELTSNSDIIVTYPLNVLNHRDSLIHSLYNPVSNSKVDGLQFQTRVFFLKGNFAMWFCVT